MTKVSLSKIATNVMLVNVKPKVSVFQNCDGSQKVIFEYDVPANLIKEFDDWRMRMEHLVDEDTREHILEQ